MKIRQIPVEFLLLVAFMIHGFLACLQLLAVLSFTAGGRLGSAQPCVAIGLVLLLPFAMKRVFPALALGQRFLAMAAFACSLAAALCINIHYSDVSCDGQAYHGAAIMQLVEGWNPLTDPTRAECDFPERIVNFPKGPWYISAQLCLLTGNCEAGKASGLLLIEGTFLIACYAFLRHTAMGALKASILALLLAANPVSINQALSYYVDGQLASLFAALVVCSCLMLRERRMFLYAYVAILVAVLCNVKLTGLVYACVFGGMLGVVVCLWRRFRLFPAIASTYLAGVLLTLLVTGYNPYVTNYRQWHNPFYPYGLGEFQKKYEKGFVEHQMPAVFRGRNPLFALAWSIFGECNNDFYYPNKSFTGGPLKIPFTVSRDELQSLVHGDARIAGWGPLTGGIFIIAVPGFIFACARGKAGEWKFGAGLALCLAVTIALVAYSWWARYAPQVWFLPVLALAALWTSDALSARRIGHGLAVLMAVNIALVAAVYFSYVSSESRTLRQQMKQIAAFPQPVNVSFGYYPFNRLRFREAGISFTAVDRIPPDKKQMILAGRVILSKTTVEVPE